MPLSYSSWASAGRATRRRPRTSPAVVARFILSSGVEGRGPGRDGRMPEKGGLTLLAKRTRRAWVTHFLDPRDAGPGPLQGATGTDTYPRRPQRGGPAQGCRARSPWRMTRVRTDSCASEAVSPAAAAAMVDAGCVQVARPAVVLQDGLHHLGADPLAQRRARSGTSARRGGKLRGIQSAEERKTSGSPVVLEVRDRGVLEELVDDADDADVLGHAGHAGPQAADAADDQVDLARRPARRA